MSSYRIKEGTSATGGGWLSERPGQGGNNSGTNQDQGKCQRLDEEGIEWHSPGTHGERAERSLSQHGL